MNVKEQPTTSGSLTIEQAGPDDVAGVYRLLEESGLPIEGLAEHIGHTLVARDPAISTEVVGSAALEVYGPYALLRSVAVDSRLRGLGVGQRLTEAALELARRENVATVYLLTETAPDFFRRFGFSPVPRDAVPAEVLGSIEFTTLCPVSSMVMGLALRGA